MKRVWTVRYRNPDGTDDFLCFDDHMVLTEQEAAAKVVDNIEKRGGRVLWLIPIITNIPEEKN